LYFFFHLSKKKKKKILDPLKPKSWLRHCRYHLLFGQESFTMQQEKVTGIACSGSARLSWCEARARHEPKFRVWNRLVLPWKIYWSSSSSIILVDPELEYSAQARPRLNNLNYYFLYFSRKITIKQQKNKPILSEDSRERETHGFLARLRFNVVRAERERERILRLLLYRSRAEHKSEKRNT
jgi:hypothetical protein